MDAMKELPEWSALSPEKRRALLRHLKGQAGANHEQVARLVDNRLAKERMAPAQRDLFTLLGTHNYNRWETVLINRTSLVTTTVLVLLLEKAWAVRFERPHEAVDWAYLAAKVGDRLDISFLGPVGYDFKGRAYAFLGNALRVLSEYPHADDMFEVSRSCLDKGTGDPLEEACHRFLLSNLRRDQNRYKEALSLINGAIRSYKKGGDEVSANHLLVQKALILRRLEKPLEAAALLRSAIERIDSKAAPDWMCAARHNLALCLHDAGECQEALRVLRESRRLARGLNLLRSRWLEGKIAEQCGEVEHSVQALEEARQGFLVEGIDREAADASLDLAVVYARQGKMLKVSRLAAEIHRVYLLLDLPEETTSALLLFVKAVKNGKATVEYLSALRESVEIVRDRKTEERRQKALSPLGS